MTLVKLSEAVAVRPQLLPHEVPSLAAAGFRGIINNRPDHEEAGQPSSKELEQAAKRHGLAYWHIPVVPGRATERDAQAFAAALDQAGGPVVAFCRSGARATMLWEMSKRGA